MSNRAQVLSLYRQLVKESTKFTSHNFREYFKLRIHHEFEANKQVNDPVQLQALVAKAHNDLASLKRQVIVSQLFPAQNSVLDK